jgi:hypothetical protein
MTKTLLGQSPAERKEESERQESGLLEAVVRDNVLSALGRPVGNHRVQVKNVWGDNYRVNVFVGPDVASFTIAHTYFLRADGNGKILTCSPPIARTY